MHAPVARTAAAASAAPTAAMAGAASGRADPSTRLERAFGEIHATRMQGLPFLNPALRVEAVGFRRWDGRWLGVLITPWFMNLMLLPDADAAWRPVHHGDALAYVLPAGVFEFISGHEPLLGEYQSCSLFSPVFEFADQDGARATAQAALQALFDAGSHAGAEGPGTARAGAAPASQPNPPPTAQPTTPVPVPPAAATPASAVSKRDFLRGRWHREDAG